MAEFDIVAGPVRLSLLPGAARFSLRIAQQNMAVAGEAFGTALPERIGARVHAGGREALCLGPDEWLLLTADDDRAEMAAAFAGIGDSAPHSLVDISDRDSVIALAGAQAEDLLATSCPRDLAAIGVGEGTRTVFDTVPVVLLKDSEADYRLACWRSYLPHVWGLLATANRELAVGL